MSKKIRLTNVQRFCNHDGEGLRTVVFLSGCPLACRWCHNPESRLTKNRIAFYRKKCLLCRTCENLPCGAHTFQGEAHFFDRAKCCGCGKCVASCPADALENSFIYAYPEEIAETALKDKAFFGDKGGVTLSGGEPTFQSEGAAEILRLCKKAGVNTAMETCGIFDKQAAEIIAPFLDQALFDIKDTDEKRLKENTGADLNEVLANLAVLDRLGIEITLRCIILAGINDNAEHLKNVFAVADGLKRFRGIDLIPYHAYGKTKYDALDLADDFDRAEYTPDKNTMQRLKNTVNVYVEKRKTRG